MAKAADITDIGRPHALDVRRRDEEQRLRLRHTGEVEQRGTGAGLRLLQPGPLASPSVAS